MSRFHECFAFLRTILRSFRPAVLLLLFGHSVITAQVGSPPEKIDINRLRAGAEAGQVAAQINLGRALELGLGTTPNPAEAARWFLVAADQGDPEAQTNLGYMYAVGLGVAQNELLAFRWFQRAATEGYAPAQNDVGALLLNGVGTKQDPVAAAYWFRRAAGCAQAGIHTRNPKSPPRNTRPAF